MNKTVSVLTIVENKVNIFNLFRTHHASALSENISVMNRFKHAYDKFLESINPRSDSTISKKNRLDSS